MGAAQATVASTRASVSVAEADVAAARTNVAAQQANVQRLTALRSFQQLTAPFDGIITARTVDRGALITAGSGSTSASLFRMARAERLRIYVRVPQTWVRALTPGGQAQVLVPEFPARTFLGQVVSTAGALDQASRTLLTEVRDPERRRESAPWHVRQRAICHRARRATLLAAGHSTNPGRWRHAGRRRA